MNNKTDAEVLTHIAAANSHLNNLNNLERNIVLARRHIKRARKVAMRKTIRLPRSIRMQFCNKCLIPFVIGKNCTVRTRYGTVILHCNACKHMQKFGGKKKIAKK